MLLALSLLISNFNGGETPHAPIAPPAPIVSNEGAKNAIGQTVVFPTQEVKPPKPQNEIASANNAQGQILSNKADEVYRILKGDWDNSLQVFFEPELGIAKEKSHKRFHIRLKEIKSNDFSPLSLRIEYLEGSEQGQVLRSRLWEIIPQYANNKIVIKQYESMAGANLTDLKKSEFSYLEGCNIELDSSADGFKGDIDVAKCKVLTKQHQTIFLGEHHEISKSFWHISDIAKNEQGGIMFGTQEVGPNIYKKANFFNCWVSAYNGTDYKTKSNLIVHDQGGEAQLKFGEKTVRIRLRDVVWPLGNNRPSLTLYLLLGKDDYSDIYSWTDSDANRIALAYGDYQASCTRE